jgi:hypothetical protein
MHFWRAAATRNLGANLCHPASPEMVFAIYVQILVDNLWEGGEKHKFWGFLFLVDAR